MEITCVIKDYEHNVKQSLELQTRIASLHAVVGKCPDCGTLLTVHPDADNLEVTIEESRKLRESNNASSIDGKPFSKDGSQLSHNDFVARPLPAPPPVYGIKDFDYATAGAVQAYSGGDLLISNVIQVIIYQYLWNCPYNRVLELLNIGSHDALLTLGRNCFRPLAGLIKDEILSYPIVHADESYMRVLYGASGNKNHSNCYVWQIALPLYTGNYLNYYRIYPGRSREYAEKLLSGDKLKVTGIVTDCYGVYDGIAKPYAGRIYANILSTPWTTPAAGAFMKTCLTHTAITVWPTVSPSGMRRNVKTRPCPEQRKDLLSIATLC